MSAPCRPVPADAAAVIRAGALVAALAAAPALAPGNAAAQSAAEGLASLFPSVFPDSTLRDAAVGGQPGVRVVAPTLEAGAAGFRAGDVVLGMHARLGAGGWQPGASGGPVFVVWRTPGEDRPVLDPAVIGRQVLDEYATLPAAQRVPMRLAVMLANQSTLVSEGGGVVLLPETEAFDAGRWLSVANPLPEASETALANTAEAVRKHIRLESAEAGEWTAGEEVLREGRAAEAQERARRAMVAAVLDPAARADTTALAAATDLYRRAGREDARQQEVLRAPEPRFGFLVESSATTIQAFLPQRTLLEVENSTGWTLLAGVRMRLPTDLPVLRDMSLLAEAGIVRNTFDAPDGSAAFFTHMQQYSLEVLYRPRVPTQLRPFFRGGAGVFPISGGCEDDVKMEQTEFGILLGGGLDVLRLEHPGLRLSVTGSYRILNSKFWPEDAPGLDGCSNTPPDLFLENDRYDFDLDAWQIGIMMALER